MTPGAPDPYATLGVAKDATPKQIRAAFKALTRKFHPDLHPGVAGAEDRFKSISVANDLLGDPDRRRRFDAGEIDAGGAERPREPYYRDFTGAGGNGSGSPDDFEDLLSRAFGATRRNGPARGRDAAYTLAVSFVDAALGADQTVTLPDGRTLAVTIPPGATDGMRLRLAGQGDPGTRGGPPGDALVRLAVAPHPHFTRAGDDILLDLPVTLAEAVLGARIEVPSLTGPVMLTVPKGAANGQTLRLRDRGLRNAATGRHGHQLVRLGVVLPGPDEPDLAAFLAQWTPRHRQTPRAALR